MYQMRITGFLYSVPDFTDKLKIANTIDLLGGCYLERNKMGSSAIICYFFWGKEEKDS